MVKQKREVSARNTQADRKEGLRSHLSEGQKAPGKPDALFYATPSNLRGSLLEGNKDHLLNQARSDLAKQELHVESLNKCIGELSHLCLKFFFFLYGDLRSMELDASVTGQSDGANRSFAAGFVGARSMERPIRFFNFNVCSLVNTGRLQEIA